jgi:cytochrome c oxidase subunit 2
VFGLFNLILDAAPQTVATYDNLFNLYLTFGTAAAVIVIGLLLFFAIKYRARDGHDPSKYPVPGWKIALVTALITASVLVTAEYQTFASESNIVVPNSPDAIHIKVLAFQWGWSFTYPNGKTTLNNLTVPSGATIILNITTKDVFHSFGIPMLAEKMDAIPGKVNTMWFQAPFQQGVYKDAIRCYELCGAGHALMIANLTVVSMESWQRWMSS